MLKSNQVFSKYTIFYPPPVNFVHDTLQHIDKMGHVATAPGPLACHSRGACPPSLS